MSFRKGSIIEIEIDKMAYGGNGLGRLDGMVVFVRGTVPGDRITARIYRKKKDYAEAALVDILSPSPHRINAPCPYSGYCGGCQWQHVRYEKQLEYKKEHVRESIEHIAGLKDPLVKDVVPSEKVFGYRNKMEFSFSDRRWLMPGELPDSDKDNFALGLHVPGTYHKVIDMETCLLQHEAGNQILYEVKKYVKNSGIPVYGLKTHEGFWRFLVLRYSTAFDEWMVNVVTSEERPEAVQPLADFLKRSFSKIKTIVNNINSRKASIAVGENEIVLSGEGIISDRIGRFTFQISANSFFQTNSLSIEKLYQKVVEFGELNGNERVIDLYSGTGTIPVFLAERVKSVTGIEITESAVADARRNCTEFGIKNCSFICGDIRNSLSSIKYKPDLMIIDPPRQGMHKDVLSQVMNLSPEKIIYVSCNPATLARDIGEMISDYELIEIQPFDMFPHTYHIEAAAKLHLRKNN
ncbi:MAG TPA: 23S rRNA (uracil(1939)-C(5))-methyltransferase RlmD [Desulfobacteraceae bacterium]|nr:23S rRNA (uracil(1939)-C(5))-methyltransferase RlmD [Desulfobacteraceae bacterium]HPJ67066.1 23S rRNA (uracil(1939)-C(5))-methyltransferase RlmD [Desulfobacteraceae bacterium]HPQ29276.1 23S rRNA (uracil(1939)-C(5))-methyltransferase RlmD [Desulfobacteraceae bacterium]